MKFTIVSNEDDDRPVFITGNFNQWNPRDKNFELTKTEENTYTIDIEDKKLPKLIEYKYSKGGWENVEIDRFGNITPNRKILKSTKKTVDAVEKWRINWAPFKSEFFPIAEIISEKFFIPQLNRTRKIWALLPHD